MLSRQNSVAVDFNFSEFFERVITWAAQKGDARLLDRLLQSLEKQIEDWIVQLPEDPEYAYKVINTLKNSTFPNIDALRNANAQLNYIKGRIFQNNLGRTRNDDGGEQAKTNAKYALICFYDAIFYGKNDAWECIGDIYYQQALRGEALTTDTYLVGLKKRLNLQSEMNGFNEAMLAYSSGPVSAQKKLLVNCLTTVYWDSISKGDLVLAGQTANTIAMMSNQNEIKPLLSRNEKAHLQDIIEHAKNLGELKQRLHESIILSSAYVSIVNAATANEMTTHLNDAVIQLGEQAIENPVVDYYLWQIWTKIAWMRKHEKLESTAVEVANRNAEEFKNKVLAAEYPKEAKPFHEFILGLGKQDGVINTKSPSEIEAHFRYAAKNGCFLAHTYLADILQVKLNESDFPAQYYLIAAKAGDPRAYFTFLHRVISQKTQFKDVMSIEDFTEFCESSLSILNDALTNPYVLRTHDEYLQNNIRELEKFYRENSHRPEELNPESPFWNEEKAKYPELFNLVKDYHQLNDDPITPRLLILHKLQQQIDLQQTVKKDNAPFLKHLLTKVNRAETYLSYKQYLVEIDALAKREPMDAFRDYVRFFIMPNGLRPQNYLEFTDPMHRRGEFLHAWSSSRKNVSYFSWLHEMEKHKPARIPQVLYLDEIQRQRLEVSFDNGQIMSLLKSEPMPDGHYLFVMNRQKQFYLADEKAESDDMHHFHHSSFLAGNPVMGAGEMMIEHGKIIGLNNFSGHYLPDILRLHQCYAELKAQNLVTDELRISVVGVENLPDHFKNITMSMTPTQFEALIVYLLENRSVAATKTDTPLQSTDSVSSDNPIETEVPSTIKDDPIALEIYGFIQSKAHLQHEITQLSEQVSAATQGFFSHFRRATASETSLKAQLIALKALQKRDAPYMTSPPNLDPSKN